MDTLPIKGMWQLYKFLCCPQVESCNPDFAQKMDLVWLPSASVAAHYKDDLHSQSLLIQNYKIVSPYCSQHNASSILIPLYTTSDSFFGGDGFTCCIIHTAKLELASGAGFGFEPSLDFLSNARRPIQNSSKWRRTFQLSRKFEPLSKFAGSASENNLSIE